MARIRYTSSRTGLAVRIGGLVIGLVGALSFTGVLHTLRRMGHAMGHNPWATAALAVGIVLVLYGFRDSLLAPFGWMSPRRAERQIKAWLESQSYGILVTEKPPMFNLTATDSAKRSVAIFWSTEPFASVIIGTQYGVGAELQSVWGQATAADLRQLTLRLMEVGTRLDGGGAQVQDLADADTAKVLYLSQIPRDLINYEEFFRRVNQVMGCLIIAINLINDLVETVKEREVAKPQLSAGKSSASRRPGR